MNTNLSLINIFEEQYQQNPYPLYHKLRSQYPTFWDEPLNAWVLTRYQDISEALKKPQLSNQRLSLDKYMFPEKLHHLIEESLKIIQRQMIFNDSSTHSSLREIWLSIFSPKNIEKFSTYIEVETTNLLDAALSEVGREFDFMSCIAFPLVSNVIYKLLGIDLKEFPESDICLIDYINFLDGKVQSSRDILKTLRSISYLNYAYSTIIEKRLKEPKNDLLQSLISTMDEHQISQNEIVANMLLLIAAGHQSSAHLMGIALLALYQNSQNYQQVFHNRALIPSLITESLRYDSPIQTIGRFAISDIKIGENIVKSGQKVLMSIGSANRDSARFNDPDLFIIQRSNNIPLSFGHGAHQCMGAALAKLEAKVVIDTLLTCLSDSRVRVVESSWSIGIASRGLEKLILNLN
ncbi:cytochrome P450 [Trichocoleus sp. DQ-A3]|uniref:cytochrome P450 n=1 Tax=Cyanophyceae TaxID=3028117 RepID=UPI001682D81C|nr:cytochrome P450 [Coleofasciculus sp. FACHB-125]MBD1903673.1 cytochrome P450 [Coleofasciculus sp. FACHB-125]